MSAANDIAAVEQSGAAPSDLESFLANDKLIAELCAYWKEAGTKGLWRGTARGLRDAIRDLMRRRDAYVRTGRKLPERDAYYEGHVSDLVLLESIAKDHARAWEDAPSWAPETAERCRYEGSCKVVTPFRREPGDQRSCVELMYATGAFPLAMGRHPYEQVWALALEGRVSWEAIQRDLAGQIAHTRACLRAEIDNGPPGACAFKEFMEELAGELELLLLVAHVHANPVILH